MSSPSYVLESSTPTADLPEVRNRTRFPSQYFQMLDTDDHVFHVMVTRITYDLNRLDENGFPRLAKQQVELVQTDEFYTGRHTSSIVQESDFSPYKPRCDVIFSHAFAHSPEEKPFNRWTAGVKIDKWDKVLMVCGPRVIRSGLLGWQLSEPEKATRVPICHELAFGGTCRWPEKNDEDADPEIFSRHELNPIGCGFLDKAWVKKTGKNEFRAPQIEVFSKAFDDGWLRGQNYPVVGLGPIGRWWQPRVQLTGSYDHKWLESRWPALPKDFDFSYWNCTPADQQIDYPKGGESITLFGLTPGGGYLRAKVPGNHPYSLVGLHAGPVLERPMHLDTLIFDMQKMTLTCVHRTNIAANAGIKMIEVLQRTQE